MPLIKQHVSPLTEIYSDEWRAYRRINKEGFNHYTVNVVVVVAELQQERWPLGSSSTVDDGLWQLWTLI